MIHSLALPKQDTMRRNHLRKNSPPTILAPLEGTRCTVMQLYDRNTALARIVEWLPECGVHKAIYQTMHAMPVFAISESTHPREGQSYTQIL